MGETRWKRPWLAMLLGTLLTGFGHLYLRRWWRALGWLLATYATMVLFVPSAATDALISQITNTDALLSQITNFEPVSVPIVDVLPLLLVGIASVFDAYVLARMNNQRVLEQQMGIQRCSNCHRPIDPDVSFCQWCANPRDEPSENEIS
ncbi:DUF7575 domain-containing protein [Halocatena marina]|uniref:DUF7575 domain-containing protein n=1 Tax=Halocatena marina TaxID=2934937 RepID=UPI00200FA4D1|nr:zinc ribbon domain-containing protein [Halocatena marina]